MSSMYETISIPLMVYGAAPNYFDIHMILYCEERGGLETYLQATWLKNIGFLLANAAR